MTLVVDANVAIAVAVPNDYAAAATDQFRTWKRSRESLIAPALFIYEATTALRRSIVLRVLTDAEAAAALDTILRLGVQTIAPDRELCRLALDFAPRINQSKAYDAHYLALASRENAAFWTADQHLAHSAQQTGLSWVHWIGE